MRNTAIVLIVLVVAIIALVDLTPVQNYLARRAAATLEEKLKTKVTVAHVRIDFLDHVLLKGVYIEGQQHDTLLYAGELQVRISDWFIFREKPVIHYLALHDAYVHFYRTAHSNAWNYDFIADAFGGNNSKQAQSKPIQFDLKKLELGNVRFHMDDQWGGEDIDIDAGSVLVNADDIDFRKKMISVHNIDVHNTDVSLNEYKAGHPPRPKDTTNVIDTTPFNPGKWVVRSKSLNLDGCSFHLTANDKIPEPGLFDQDHLAITNIKIATSTISIIGDTIRGKVNDLFAHERCGLEIRKMTSDVTVSPIASICSNLYLETNNSKIRNYYSMNYKRFPDFLNYIDSVVMVARLKDATVDVRDIAYFAPELKKFPNILLHASGSGRGTVANLGAKDLVVADGNSVLKGNMTMKGLPDIYKTKITWTNGELATTGQGILRYVPTLRNSPDIALERIIYAYFKGGYDGYIEDFRVNGILRSNLGDITADVKMALPGFRSRTAEYSGTITTGGLQLGILLKQPLLGGITLKEDIAGNSFDPDDAEVSLDGNIKELNLNGYAYHSIITHGTLAKKEFDGTLLVDDPNLGLEFDGGIDYSNKNINIKATAHLLGSNFKAMNLTADTVTASADFDLNCTGSNIDNFSGYALLNNIDMKRNSNRVALDSVLINATGDSLNKQLSIQSNNLMGTIKGNYQLSKLSASVQYYLSRYLPNYISVPDKFAPEQDFSFQINTYNIDSIWAVTFPIIKGFDSSHFTGSLNTKAQKVALAASVPYGSIGKVHMNNIVVSGNGTLDAIGLSTNIDNVSIGDSIVNGSLSLTASVANDSVAFTVATTTTDTGSSITLNGQVIARKDSLFLTMLPSQFFLNQARWDISGGSKIVYSHKYLQIDGLSLTSGLQKITASTQMQNSDRYISINAENLDLGQLGTWAGLAAYQPDGRVNGSVTIDKVFDDLYISTNLKATGVMLGADTVGNINVIGEYDGAKKLITFDPQSGIYRGNASVAVSGKVSFDSATHQQLDGKIEFTNAPVALASPFLTGIMSHLGGTLDGSIKFDGSSLEPLMNGDIAMRNAAFKVDYMGCNYTIPTAKIHVDNKIISFGKVTAYDAYKNHATLTGNFTHNLFRKMNMNLKIASEKIEVMNLTLNDNNLFYGNVFARMDSFTITGPFDNILLNAYNAEPAAKSKLYIPESSPTGGDAGSYNYASFKTYGIAQGKLIRKNRSHITINIDANINKLLETHIILDPSTGDEIMARGNGRIQLDIPASNDITMNGIYVIDNGQYSYTFKQLRFTRYFKLNSGSTINFNGPFSQTGVSVDAVYQTKARLFDLLSDADKNIVTGTERTDAQTPQLVNVMLHMNGYLSSARLTFDIDIDDKRSQNTLAYSMLKIVNSDDTKKFNEVISLLVLGDFTSPEGLGNGSVVTGAINNISQILSSSTSTALTTALNKLTGNKQYNVDVKYTNYNYSDQTFGAINRNEVKLGLNKSYFNNKLQVEVGGTSDWGHQASTSTATNFDLTGDFRLQYQLSEQSNLRANAFRTSDYDVTLDRDIIRSGVGITWRKSFDRLNDFFRGNRYIRKQKQLELKNFKQPPGDSSSVKPTGTE